MRTSISLRSQRELTQLNDSLQCSNYQTSGTDDQRSYVQARQPTTLETKIGENRDTALIDLLEDETQLPEHT